MKTTEEIQSYISTLHSVINIQQNKIEVGKKRIKQEKEKHDLTLVCIRIIHDLITSNDESKQKEGILYLSNLACPNKVAEKEG